MLRHPSTRNRRLFVVSVVPTVIVTTALFLLTSSASAANTFDTFAVFGEHGVMIGVGSSVTGIVGARNNRVGGQASLTMNGSTTINGDAHTNANVTMGNNTRITGTLYRVGTLTANATAAIGRDLQVVDSDLPVGSIPSQWPTTGPSGPASSYCAVAHGPDITNGNGTTINLTPGTWGTIRAGSVTTLNFIGAGDYFIDALTIGSVSITFSPGVRIFVCSRFQISNITSAPPAFPVYLEAAVIPRPADGDGVQISNGPWVGDIVVPNGGIQYGSGSSQNASVTGHLWADFVDIEHGVVITQGETTTTTECVSSTVIIISTTTTTTAAPTTTTTEPATTTTASTTTTSSSTTSSSSTSTSSTSTSTSSTTTTTSSSTTTTTVAPTTSAAGANVTATFIESGPSCGGTVGTEGTGILPRTGGGGTPLLIWAGVFVITGAALFAGAVRRRGVR